MNGPEDGAEKRERERETDLKRAEKRNTGKK